MTFKVEETNEIPARAAHLTQELLQLEKDYAGKIAKLTFENDIQLNTTRQRIRYLVSIGSFRYNLKQRGKILYIDFRIKREESL